MPTLPNVYLLILLANFLNMDDDNKSRQIPWYFWSSQTFN